MDESFIASTGKEKLIKTVKAVKPNYHARIEQEKSLSEIITYEEPKIDLELLKKRGSANSFAGWLIGKMNSANSMEMKILLQEIYKKYKEFTTKNAIKIEIIDGWKWKDSIKIENRFDEDIIILSHIKDKETNEVTTSKHIVTKENINNMLTFISYWEINESHSCYDFSDMLGCKDWKEVWKERTNIYFPKYYYPIKVLESLGLIKYSGKGKVTRVKWYLIFY